METDVRLITATLLLVTTGSVVANTDRCAFMLDVPKSPRPDLPDSDFPGLTWQSQPFLPAFQREEVCMNSFQNPTQSILMDEEIEGDVVLARLNYKGDQVPTVLPSFIHGQSHLLGAVIRRIPENTGDWHLVVTNKQDYEVPEMQSYIFAVFIPGEFEPRVHLTVVNIDDNSPIIFGTNTCQIPESEVPGLTECTYMLTDIDGYISTGFMTYQLTSNRNDHEFFEIVNEEVPTDRTQLILKIKLKQKLNFESNALHIFEATAFDSLPNNGSSIIMVRVENVNSRPPRWVTIFAMQRFDEKKAMDFEVMAVDGDTGINSPIFYRILTDPRDTFFSIKPNEDRGDATLYVDPIDRDTLEREVFQLDIVAYKRDENGNELFNITNSVVIIVNDINDREPEPFQRVYSIDIHEETALTLNLENFGFHDRDLGDNAVYTVELEAETPKGAEAGFQVSPSTGYQRQNFIVTTLNHGLLDFEDEPFQNIKLKVIATDTDKPEFVQEAILNVNLINWNDEQPIFAHATQTVTFRETVGKGFFVADVTAKDRDIDDKVIHELLGNAGGYLEINPDTGAIHVSIDNAFDYHRQNELLVQVQARDTLGDGPYHTATSQLVIQLIDVNNSPPNLRLPRGRPEVEENVPEGFPIHVAAVGDTPVQEITANDPDTDAKLVFEINWEASYATKQGRETPPAEFHNCVEIETVYPNPEDTRSAVGRLRVKEIRPGVTIDFEEFEILYLTVRVTDLNTEIGQEYDEATYTIIIIDMNDNKPLWAEGMLTQDFRVRENSDTGVVIGSVLATDIDGPLYNQVRYTLFTREDTPEDLVQIDFHTGQITVKAAGKIDADEPRDNLYYTLRASDGCFADNKEDCPPDPTVNINDGDITIRIIDTNNKVPEEKLEKNIVYVWENATDGDEIATVFATDQDRDKIYHTVSYQIDFRSFPRLRSFFEVDINTGVVRVEYPTDETLDRDGDEPEHRIVFILTDNFDAEGDGNRNQNSTEILVVLLDVNDNAPELPARSELTWTISENFLAGRKLSPRIHAPDRDEPNTDNSRVGYEILSLTSINRDIEVPDLFTMIQIDEIDKQLGELETAKDLRGYWGTYDIHILAYDHGYPQQSSNETYELVITPYNFHDPVFVFPQPDALVRVAREPTASGALHNLDGSPLRHVHATDEDGLEAGTVTFEIIGDEAAVEHLTIRNDGENLGTLFLDNAFEENVRDFEVTIRATDGGTDPGPRSTDVTFTLAFVPTQGDPIFTDSTFAVSFFEDEDGLSERFPLPRAEDPKNHGCDGDCHSIYYSIVQGNTAGHFAVDPTTNEIYVVKKLDRSEGDTHTIVVAASNSPGTINIINALAGSLLTVTVNVRESNPRPIFQHRIYTAGISATDIINRNLLTVLALHTEGAPITYSIDFSTMVVDPTLEAVRDTAFVLNPTTGVLTLNIQPTALMHGMFEFEIVATDNTGAYDRTQVKIYLISSQNRVMFRFRNSLEQIEENSAFIAQTFSAGFAMTCNVDQIVPATDNDLGTVIEGLTEMRAHFIRDNVPVLADEIESLRSDVVLLRSVQLTLSTELLVLEDFTTVNSPNVNADNTMVTVYVLVVLTAVLGLLCIVLLVTFILRTRALNRRLEALSMTKYGSVDSGLNRVGITPGTNKHAVEGSNPIWNETIKAPDFDAISNASNDSDLIGIEDLPQFRNDYFPTTADSNLPGVTNNEPVATHGNNFRFNATPFSPEFANRYKPRQ